MQQKSGFVAGLIVGGLAALLVVLMGALPGTYAATPPITVPPAFTAPQEQASELALPAEAAFVPSSAVVVTACNNVRAVIVTDTAGGVHTEQFKNRNALSTFLRTFDAVRVWQVDLGCDLK